MKPGADFDTVPEHHDHETVKEVSSVFSPAATISAAGFLYCAQDLAFIVVTETPVLKAKVDQP